MPVRPRPRLRLRPQAHNRNRTPGGRYQRISIRLTADEHAILTAAASRAGLTTAGFTAHAALSLATDLTAPAPTGGSRRGQLAALQRELLAARTAIHALTRALLTGADTPTTAGLMTTSRRAVTHLDETTADIHRHLRSDNT